MAGLQQGSVCQSTTLVHNQILHKQLQLLSNTIVLLMYVRMCSSLAPRVTFFSQFIDVQKKLECFQFFSTCGTEFSPLFRLITFHCTCNPTACSVFPDMLFQGHFCSCPACRDESQCARGWFSLYYYIAFIYTQVGWALNVRETQWSHKFFNNNKDKTP